MGFRISGLDPALFQGLHRLSDAELAARGAKRVLVEAKPGAPCRISLDDAEVGESVLLLSYLHQGADTPYRQQGPIFVRETQARFEAVDRMPPALAQRPLSLRGFDAGGMMVEADVCEGAEAPALIAHFFAKSAVAYIHAHYARRGCFAARVDRA
ncbi:MAG: DUF1203 domain-containing protein [Vitreimonas sp.]